MNTSREERLFELAMEKPIENRSAFLDAVCGGDTDLRQRIEGLLPAHDQDSGFLPGEGTTESSATLLDESTFTEGSGTQIDQYKLLEKLGEGGFGSVWAAEQKEPVRRRVALKIIKLGMDTKQVVARFEAERQALALMDHPNIAKVLDAGATETGRPYFVMELVKGMPITKYCNQEKLDTGSRLDLFIKVCQAIQHAHQKGIIHRDIKPSNIMVTLHDGVPVPKVIDFGIAKATQQELTEKTIYTQYSQFIGTPAYMSPEQAEMSGLDIDTRSDIYSLGVLLYELLTDSTPFDAKELMQSGIDEMRRIIREQEPQRPSTKMATLEASDRTTTAEQRSSDLPRLINLLKGDLDWIVMKCLEKDRTRRYDTANGLAADLKRHLINEPVLARPPSAAYKFQKAWRRNKLVYTAAMAVAVALIIGFTFSAWQATVATHAKIKAETSQQKAVAAEGRTQAALVLTESARDRAIRSAGELRKQIYVSDISLAHRAVEDGDLGRAQALLGKHKPKPGMEDLRGFEWRHLWSQSQGNFESDLGPYVGYISGVTISPDGQFVALNRHNPTQLEIIHLASGSVAKSIELPGAVFPLVFSPSGNFLIGQMHGTQNKLIAWDTRNWKTLEPIPLTPPFVFGYRDEQEIMVARDGDQLSMWDVTHWQTLGPLENKEPNEPLMDPSYGLVRHMVNVLAVSSDGSVAYLAGASKIRRWDLNQRTELPPLNVEGMACLATSDDGQLAGGDAIGNVLLIHPHSGEILYSSKSHTAWTMCLKFTRDGIRLISANQDRNLVVHDTVNRSIVGRLLGHKSEVTALDVSADGQTVISGNNGGRVLRWSLAESADEAFNLGAVNVSSVLKDGRILLLRDDSRDLEYYDPMSNAVEPAQAEPLVQAMRERKVNPIEFSPTARWALSINGSKLAVWNIFTGELERSLAHPSGMIRGAMFSPDGKLLVTDGETETRLWQTNDWTSESLGPNVESHLNWGSFSRGNGQVAIAAPNESIHVYDIAHEPREFVPKDNGETSYSVALSNNGRWLAAGGKTLRIWDLESKTLKATLRGHVQGVLSLSFSPDDRTLVSCTGTKVVFWNVATWQELMRYSDDTTARLASIPRVEFSPNDRYLSRVGTHIGEAGIRIRIWQAPSFEEIEAMEDRREQR